MGFFSLVDIAPAGFEYNESGSVDNQTAILALQNAELEIQSLRDSNFTTDYFEDVILEAQRELEKKNYNKVHELSELISFMRIEKQLVADEIVLMENKLLQIAAEINVSSAMLFVSEAKKSLNNTLIDEARLELEEANLAFEEAAKEKSRLNIIAQAGKNFFVRYWWQIIFGIVVLAIISPPIAIHVHKFRLKKKIKRMELEFTKTKELVRQLQKTCFVDKKITTVTYKAKVKKLEEKIAQIKHTLPILTAELKGKKVAVEKEKGVLQVTK